jgi:nucleosome assembly protein 1-like 1
VASLLDVLNGNSSGFVATLPAKVQARVKVLQEIQSEHDKLEAKFHEERAALEAKYQKLYEPLYAKRSDIVNGVVDVEAPKGEAPEATPASEEGSETVKGVPEFWLMAMKTNDIVSMQITERDEAALKHLKDIKSCNLEENKGFKLDFYFEENPFFKNTVLSKTYHMLDDDEPILERAVGTEIEWTSGKNLTQKVMKKKPKKGAKIPSQSLKLSRVKAFSTFLAHRKFLRMMTLIKTPQRLYKILWSRTMILDPLLGIKLFLMLYHGSLETPLKASLKMMMMMTRRMTKTLRMRKMMKMRTMMMRTRKKRLWPP